ncbi:MAG: radical SAM (seleno)protein TrsS [Terracidiphilus sp.]
MMEALHFESGKALGVTESVCPECLRRVTAERVAEDDAVYLRKSCPEHGVFKTVIWRGLASYASWGSGNRTASRPTVCRSAVERGCPYDCGLCPDHRQHTCCVVLDVTSRCNLACPVCFASANTSSTADPSLDEIEGWCRALMATSGPVGIHLSGGEPTVRRDLPEVIRRIRALGFSYIQLNTNGLRISLEVEYAGELKAAGLSCVFLQFDGVTDEVFKTIRGRPMLETKLTAIRNCGQQELGVVLVPTLIPGVNSAQVGEILRTAIALAPTVRAVHFQPVSYFGRYPAPPRDADRITIPEVLRFIEEQSEGQFTSTNFYPASGENPYCSFHGKFWLYPNGRIVAAARPAAVSCCGPAPEPTLVQLGSPKREDGEGARRAKRFVAQNWAFPPRDAWPEEQNKPQDGINTASLDAFLAEDKESFCISGMAFQDAWNLDLERLRECFLHVLSPEQKLVPLCAYNLTGAQGQTLYRGQCASRESAGATP